MAQEQIKKTKIQQDPEDFQVQRRWLSLQQEKEREREGEGRRIREGGCVSISSIFVAIISIPFGQILTHINATGGPASWHKSLRCLAQLKTV